MLATVHSRYRRAVADAAAADRQRHLLADLEAEQTALDEVVRDLDDAGWATSTPAAGWDVRDGIAHLAVSEELAGTALTDEAGFEARLAALVADLEATQAALEDRGRRMPGASVLTLWRDARAATLDALRDRDARDRVPWIAGPMSATSFATARLMETWAHGEDVRAGLGVPTAVTERLRHVAELGVRTRPFAYAVRGLTVPDASVRVELDGPDGARWVWGGEGSDLVRGTALDFCRVVTQRRHPDDTALEIRGAAAREWMSIAQAFAGPPTEQRPRAS
jgi:uncharacterized protein (TIGR03084 family)